MVAKEATNKTDARTKKIDADTHYTLTVDYRNLKDQEVELFREVSFVPTSVHPQPHPAASGA